MTPDYQEQLEAILRDCTGEFAAQYRLRNEAREPYSIKIAERKAEDAITKALAAINVLNKEAISQHLPGCPYITKYIGPEGEPYDGPACDCGVLDLRRRFGVEGEKK